MQRRADHAVIFLSRLGNARHTDRIPFHKKAGDLTLGFPRSLPAPEIAQTPPIGFAHAVEYDGAI